MQAHIKVGCQSVFKLACPFCLNIHLPSQFVDMNSKPYIIRMQGCAFSVSTEFFCIHDN